MERLLIVEDDHAIRQLLEISLAGAGFEIEAASDGREAIRAISQESPDILLTDFNLPYADGLDVCMAMRDQCKSQLIPALIVTGSRIEDQRLNAALRIPGVMILRKPIRVGSLPAVIHCLSAYWHGGDKEEAIEVAAKATDEGRNLPGEDLETNDPRVAMRWQSTYRQLVEYKNFMLDHTAGFIQTGDPGAAAELQETDLPFLQRERDRLLKRQALWAERAQTLEAS